MNYDTANTGEGVSKQTYLTHGIHEVVLKEVKKADWSGGNALDATFVNKDGLEYRHRIFEFKYNSTFTNKKTGTPITEEEQFTGYLSFIKHIFNKCYKNAEKGKFDTNMAKVTSFDTLVSYLASLAKNKTPMLIKLVDDGKGYAKFPKYINSGFCDWVDSPEYDLKFNPDKEGKKEKPADTESSKSATDEPWVAPWDAQ